MRAILMGPLPGTPGAPGAPGPAPAGTGVVGVTTGVAETLTVGPGLELVGAPGAQTFGMGAGSRPALDVNHVHVWYGESVTGVGDNAVPADVGGQNLVAADGKTALAAAWGGNYRTKKSVTYSGLDAGSSFLRAQATIGNIAPVSDAFTVEFIIRLSTMVNSRLGNACYYRISDGTSNNYYQWDLQGRFLVVQGGVTVVNDSVFFGGSSGQVSFDVPHHVMFSWVPVAGTPRLFTPYIDGIQQTQRQHAAWGAGVAFNRFEVCFPSGGFVSDVRLSNVGRSAAYAWSATYAMRQI